MYKIDAFLRSFEATITETKLKMMLLSILVRVVCFFTLHASLGPSAVFVVTLYKIDKNADAL